MNPSKPDSTTINSNTDQFIDESTTKLQPIAANENEHLPLLSADLAQPRALQHRDRSMWRYFAIAGWALGSNFSFSAEFVLGTPMFRALGLSPVLNSVVWLAGPISGLLVQPIVGALSDKHPGRYGRRRVFVLWGVFIGTLGLGFFGSATQIALDNSGAIGIAVVSLWTLNIGLNIVQAAGWALVLDLCATPRESARGTAAVTTLTAVGNLSATLLGFAPLATVLTFFLSDSQALFFIGMALFVLSCIPTLVASKETPFVPPPRSMARLSMRERARSLGASVKSVPRWFWRLCLVYSFSSAATTPILFSFTDFVATSCFGGVATSNDPKLRALYDEGVHWGSLCLALQSGVVFFYSLVLPYLQRCFSIRVLYMIGHVLGSVALALPFFAFAQTPTMAMVISVPYAIFNASFSTLPFGLLSVASTNSDSGGLFVGVLNAFQVVAQLVINAIYGVIVQKTGNPAYGIAFGALFAIVGTPLCFILERNEHQKQ
jgi:maltose/moltooligosaccharide transporter